MILMEIENVTGTNTLSNSHIAGRNFSCRSQILGLISDMTAYTHHADAYNNAACSARFLSNLKI